MIWWTTCRRNSSSTLTYLNWQLINSNMAITKMKNQRTIIMSYSWTIMLIFLRTHCAFTKDSTRLAMIHSTIILIQMCWTKNSRTILLLLNQMGLHLIKMWTRKWQIPKRWILKLNRNQMSNLPARTLNQVNQLKINLQKMSKQKSWPWWFPLDYLAWVSLIFMKKFWKSK